MTATTRTVDPAGLPALSPLETPGLLLVIEGTDGAGKSTLLGQVGERLRAAGHDVLDTFQPTPSARAHEVFRGFSEIGGARQELYRALYLVTLGDRLYHAHAVMLPHLMAGGVVVCDRYVYTTLANLIAREQECEPWFLDAAGHLPRPDLAVLVHCPLETAVARIRARPEEAERPIDLAHMGRVYEGFRSLEAAGVLRGIDTSVTGIADTADTVCRWVDEALAAKGAR
ncbi:dTMP kinase [Kitasatospora sp. NPDC093550]|uniref:dTMP kinase n=1 Tax=Kitasatospora sp. NPDC093550 TaxID=3364089 RepID=UPI00380D8866